jgi:ribulose-phosphate 3-epimerase
MGTFFELYHLPLQYFIDLRRRAEERGILITSMFTSHRELGGYFNPHPFFSDIASKNFRRLIEVAATLGARFCGSNPGAVFRDGIQEKEPGIERYLQDMKQLMVYAQQHGLQALNMEYMSCGAEPPSTLEEIQSMTGNLMNYHRQDPKNTVPVYACADISHGYIDEHDQMVWDHLELFEKSLPFTSEFHFKNTDSRYHSTFGFTDKEMEKGIIQLEEIREIIERNQEVIPVKNIIGYLELPGPKLGRDYSDPLLGTELRESLRRIKAVFT